MRVERRYVERSKTFIEFKQSRTPNESTALPHDHLIVTEAFIISAANEQQVSNGLSGSVHPRDGESGENSPPETRF